MTRLEFVARLIHDLAGLCPDAEGAAVFADTIAHHIDLELADVRTRGFRDGVEAAQAVAQPDAELARLHKEQDAAFDGMLAAFVQIPPGVSH